MKFNTYVDVITGEKYIQWCNWKHNMRDSTIVQQQPPCPGGLPLSIAPGREGPPVWYCGPSLIPFAFEVGGEGRMGEAGSDRDGSEKEKMTGREKKADRGRGGRGRQRARGGGRRERGRWNDSVG